MNDRDLLELAAKAVGIDPRRLPHAWPDRLDDDQWDPLVDDGDAFRLAVQLGIQVFSPNFPEYHADVDACPAVRLAIVEAAARLGAP